MSTTTGPYKIFKNQKLTLTLETGRDLSSASTMSMLIVSPSGDTITKSATVTGTTAGYIQSTFTTTELYESGLWKFKAYEADDNIRGEVAAIYVYDDWEA